MANGVTDGQDPPNYSILLNRLKHKIEKLEKELTESQLQNKSQ